jgi:hypothetical protein
LKVFHRLETDNGRKFFFGATPSILPYSPFDKGGECYFNVMGEQGARRRRTRFLFSPPHVRLAKILCTCENMQYIPKREFSEPGERGWNTKKKTNWNRWGGRLWAAKNKL